ncbi:MAG: chemotaxis protein CheB [Pseudomonadota bacterium]|nr:chemotaxis protein CheB [Pseudomonadota bacterium]
MEQIELRYPGVNPVFFIGASSGGVKALEFLAERLPEDFPSPLFFLLHRRREGADTSSMLQNILASKTKLNVVVAEDGAPVNGGTIYLPQDNKHLALEDNRIMLLDKPDTEEWRPSIDVLFKSGAREYTERAIAVLLTGKLDDGVDGLRETTFQGGITIAQSPADAYDPHLPLNALLNDHPIYVLPIRDMPKLFCELAQHYISPDQREIAGEAAIAARRIKQDPARGVPRGDRRGTP